MSCGYYSPMRSSVRTRKPVSATSLVLFTIVSAVILMVLNVASQAFEDSIGLVAPAVVYYQSWLWYADDIIAPALYLAAGIALLLQSGLSFRSMLKNWPVTGLGLAFIAMALGDTLDAHWVVAKGAEAEDLVVSFTSWMSKIGVVIVTGFLTITARHRFERRAADALIFVFLLIWIDQIQMSIALDFAGYAFHVFEELLEVATAAIACFAVGGGGVVEG